VFESLHPGFSLDVQSILFNFKSSQFFSQLRTYFCIRLLLCLGSYNFPLTNLLLTSNLGKVPNTQLYLQFSKYTLFDSTYVTYMSTMTLCMLHLSVIHNSKLHTVEILVLADLETIFSTKFVCTFIMYLITDFIFLDIINKY
jgi:hypothetical protein